MQVHETVTLYYRDGSSDKVYTATLAETAQGHVVNFAFGRRGAALKPGTKTTAPVTLGEAKKVYQKLVAEKMAKGYTPGADGTPFVATANEGRRSGALPQLLTPIDLKEAGRLVEDQRYLAQPKLDGHRRMIRHTETVVEGINRKGLIVPVPEPIAAIVRQAPNDFLIDGEIIGDCLFAFDILEEDQCNVRDVGATKRYRLLERVLSEMPVSRAIVLVPTAFDAASKLKMLEEIVTYNGEGIVFKDKTAPYVPGRWPTQLKFKLWASASLIVTAINQQRSIAVAAYASAPKGRVSAPLVPLGNVTIPPNAEIPAIGAVVEIEYLYAFPGGSIYQPKYRGPRDDISSRECLVSQLKYKA